jgi:hypothetical protein
MQTRHFCAAGVEVLTALLYAQLHEKRRIHRVIPHAMLWERARQR